MTTAEGSVVTPERYAQGRNWSDYVEYIGTPENLARPGPRGGARADNSERMQRNIDQYVVKPEQVAALRALPKYKVLAIGEDWCPDVYRGLPVIAAVCEAAGWELRLFQRDDNEDMTAEFPNIKDGQSFNSIPVIAFYSADGFTEVAPLDRAPQGRRRDHQRHRQGIHPPGGRVRGRHAHPPARALPDPADLRPVGRLAPRLRR